ncbi:MAG: copper chaperone PCu(A)C [Actinobacteria bacterium]|nr:copper chaperone PCu(A)C [Actinomycetota bacterium]
MRRVLTVLGTVIVLAMAGCEATPSPLASSDGPRLSVEGPWVRTTTGARDATMTAAFLTIVNPGDADVRLVGADCADAAMVQVHEMVMADDKMVMQEAKDGLFVPAGSHLHLTPGGPHIMLMQLRTGFAVGDQVALTLRFSDGSTLAVTAPVKEFVEEEDHYHSPSPTPSPSS